MLGTNAASATALPPVFKNSRLFIAGSWKFAVRVIYVFGFDRSSGSTLPRSRAHTIFVIPGIGTGGTEIGVFQLHSLGTRLSCEFIACSHVISCPV